MCGKRRENPGGKHRFKDQGQQQTWFRKGRGKAHRRDAATANFLAGASIADCKDAATADFLTGASVAHCKDAATANFWQALL